MAAISDDLKAAVRAWNEENAGGTEVVVMLESDREIVTRTRSGACIVGSTGMILTEDIRNWVRLDQVRPLAAVLAEATGKAASISAAGRGLA